MGIEIFPKGIRIGRPRTGRRTPAQYQAARREREAKYDIKELRGIRISASERQLVADLVEDGGYQDKTELLMELCRERAKKRGIKFKVKPVEQPIE